MFNKECTRLIDSLLADEQSYKVEDVGVRTLFDLIGSSEVALAKFSLGKLLQKLRKLLISSMKTEGGFLKEEQRRMFQVFEAAIRLSQRELIPAIEKFPPRSMERLYCLKFLDAMVFQVENSCVVEGFSYRQIISSMSSQKNAVAEALQFECCLNNSESNSIVELYQISKFCLEESTATHWKTFIQQISLLPEEEKHKITPELVSMLLLMNKTNMLPIWMSMVFDEAWKIGHKNNDPVLTIVKKMKKMMKPNQNTLDWIEKKLCKLRSFEKQVSLWENPVHVAKNTKKLSEIFENELGFELLKAKYEGSEALGCLALMRYIRIAVNLHDTIIKMVKGSSLFKSENEQVMAFAELLKGYLTMMESILFLIGDVDEQKEIMKPDEGVALTFQNYVNALKKGKGYYFGQKFHYSIGFDNLVHYLAHGESKFKFQSNSTENEMRAKYDMLSIFPPNPVQNSENMGLQLIARDLFSVQSLVVGSKADTNFSVHWPNRLEEYFTTFHQNMEFIIKYLNQKNGMSTITIAPEAKEMSALIQSKFNVEISQIEMENEKILIQYQIPLRQHSGSLTLTYNPLKCSEGMDITMQMFGTDEGRRWEKTATIGTLLAYLIACGFTEGQPPELDYLNPRGIKFSVHLDQTKSLHDRTTLIETLWITMCKLTMDDTHKPEELKKLLENGEHTLDLQFNGFESFDWNYLPPECFQTTLWMNGFLLKHFIESNDETMVLRVALHSIIGIAQIKLKDFRTPESTSLKRHSMEALKTLASKKNNVFLSSIQELIDNPDFASWFPNEKRELTKLL